MFTVQMVCQSQLPCIKTRFPVRLAGKQVLLSILVGHLYLGYDHVQFLLGQQGCIQKMDMGSHAFKGAAT